MFGPANALLANELIYHILSYFTPEELGQASLVNQTWNRYSKADDLWKVLLKQHFPASQLPEKDFKKHFIELHQELKPFPSQKILDDVQGFMRRITWRKPSGRFVLNFSAHDRHVKILISKDDPNFHNLIHHFKKDVANQPDDGHLQTQVASLETQPSIKWHCNNRSKYFITFMHIPSCNVWDLLANRDVFFYCKLTFPKAIGNRRSLHNPCPLEMALKQECINKITELARARIQNTFFYVISATTLITSIIALSILLTVFDFDN